jgi:hypothetical protein
MNSIAAMRMLRQIQYPDPPAAPPVPEKKPRAAPVRAPRKPKEDVIEHIEPESNSDSGSDSSSYDEFPEVEEIQQRFKAEPCEYISPVGLSKAKTKKEAMKYLEQKACPKIPDLKKKRMSSPAAPTPSTAPAKKERKPKAAPEPVLPPTQSPEVVLANPPQKKVKKVTEKKADLPAAAPAQGAPLASSEPAAKKKRAASAYALAVGRHRKAGLSFTDAAKAAKAELDAKKKKD